MSLSARAALRSGWVVLLPILGACSTDANPVRDAVQRAGLGPKIAPAPDFVVASRPESLDYLPVGRSPAAPAGSPKRADELKAAEAEMEALRAKNESRGAAARRAGGAKPAAPPSAE